MFRSMPRSSRGFLARARLQLFSVLLGSTTIASSALAAEGDAPAATNDDEIEEMIVTDPRNILPTAPSASSFGFAKPLIETPRSVSMISEESIDLFGLTAIEDLVRVVPGVFTTTRFGIQGGIDVRGVPADIYFRGMKRVNLQGHGRTTVAAMDNIEVVRGPPSPIFGMGKIGGYTNMSPKSGRAAEGVYLGELQGFVQALGGSYDRTEFTAGLGGPANIMGKEGGFYLFGLLEDSDSYARQVPVEQKLFQAALSLDEFIGPFRLETGVQYQLSRTAGSLINRVNQSVVDDGTYVRGSPLVNLDLNGNGKIGFLEYQRASPVRGALSAANQPLIQRFNWQRDAGGNLLPLDQFASVAGIPATMYNYLVANCGGGVDTQSANCPDPTGLLRAQGIGGPVPSGSGANGRQLPVGFVLDPRTVGYDELDPRRSDAFEKEVEAEFLIGFADLVWDVNPDFTIKNQLFYDHIDQFKLSEQPGGGKQDVTVWEDKLTATYRIQNLPDWLAVNSLASINYRNTVATGYRYGGDFSTNRTDVMNGRGEMTPNTTFVHSFENEDINNDGAPWTSDYETEYWETGIGLLFDIDIFENTNLMLGARYDYSEAENTDKAGTFNPTTGTSANPGAFRTTSSKVDGADAGVSWSVSLSHEFPYGIRPYVTIARSSLTLESNNNSMDPGVIQANHIGQAELEEVGVKISMLDKTLFFSLAGFEQTRTDVATQDDPTLGAEVTSSETTGVEAEIKWVPNKNLFVSFYALKQESEFLFDTGGNILVDARTLGFRDVLDANGNVVYPAEAFLYGGRAFLVLPAGLKEYRTRQGNPETQFGLNATYQLDNGLGFTLSANRFSKVHSGRLQLVELPETEVVNLGVFWEQDTWRIKLDVFNATNERYFRARSGDTLGDALVSAMPERRWQLTLTSDF